jgi:LmbE family N-acetylglucosaminyl deacetylase
MVVYDHLYLSPHLDDAALSCGGTIAGQIMAGESALVITLFAGDPPDGRSPSPFAIELHARWGLGSAPMAGRRAEDRRALHVLGAASLHLSFPDAVYRAGPDGAPLYPSREAIFSPPHPYENRLVDELAQTLATLTVPAAARVYAPLGIGGHVDHVLARRAAERWRPTQTGFWYYEEYPYAETPAQIADALGSAAWHQHLVPLTPADLSAKADAIACYTSQITSLFTDLADMRERVHAYAARVADGYGGYAERFYRAG